jgi:hypothetical protein
MRNSSMIAVAAIAALVLAGAAPAMPADWTRFADTETIEIVTTDEDGGQRLTTVWIVVLDWQAYIRTSSTTTWGDNVERNGSLELREVGGDRPLRAEKVLSAAEVERVVAAFREKYGNVDLLMELFRFGDTRVFRLVE